MSDAHLHDPSEQGSSVRNYTRDTFFYELLRNESKASSAWRPTLPPGSLSMTADPPAPAEPPRRDSLAPHLASPLPSAHDPNATLATWYTKWRSSNGSQGPFDELVDVFSSVVKIASALHTRHLALVIARPEYFSVQYTAGGFPIVQLRSFAGVVELPGWERARPAGSLSHSAAYIEHRTLDPSNLTYMARELFNAKDGWEGEPASVFSCGALFRNLLAEDQKPVDQPPKDDFSIVEALYRHLRRGSQQAAEKEKAKTEVAPSPVIKLLHDIIAICADEPAARYTCRGLLSDLRQVALVARGQQKAEAVHVGRVNQVSRYQDQDVLLDRVQQLAALDEAFYDVVDNNKLRIGHVFGASGSGKSRLVERWTSHMQEENPEVVVVRSKLDPNVTKPLPSFTAILEDLLHRISGHTPNQNWPRKVEVQDLLRGQPKLASLLSKEWRQVLLGDNSQAETDEDWSLFLGGTMVTFKRLLRLLTSHAPTTVIVVDDAQWLGQDELQLWRSILSDGARLENLLVISIHRSSANPPPASCLANESSLIAEALPLSAAAISDFLQAQFRWDTPPSILTSFIFRETGGNAFYVRRLLKLLVEHVFTFDYVQLCWNVDLSALPTYAADGIDQFVSRALHSVSTQALMVLQSLTFLPTRDIEISLLAAFHPQLKIEPLLAEASQRGILIFDGTRAVRWAHDKLREAAAATISPGEERRNLHQSMGLFLQDYPGFLFDAADNLLEARDGLGTHSEDPQLSVLLCRAAQASLRTSISSADRYLSAAELLMDYGASQTWERYPETCLSYILAKAEISTKLHRVTNTSLDEVAGALTRCEDLLQKLSIWTALVRMTAKSLPQKSVEYARQAVAAAGYSFEADNRVPSTAEDFDRLEGMLQLPSGTGSPQDAVRIALLGLIGHFIYPTFMTCSLDKQIQVSSLGIHLAATSPATLHNAASAYVWSWYGHQRSTLLEMETAFVFNSVGSRLLAKCPGSPFEADTRLTLDLQLHLTTPLCDISYRPSWDTALRSGNYRMAAFALVLGTSSAIMADRLCARPASDELFADFPGWDAWLPLLGEQCVAIMAAVRQARENLVSPTGADSSGDYPVNGDLRSPELSDPTNPLFSLAAAALQLHTALLFEASNDAFPPILALGEASYPGGTGMPLHYEWAFLRSLWRAERGSAEEQELIQADIDELGHITATRDWSCRIALIRTKLLLREASPRGLSGLLECASSVEETSASLVDAGYDGWSNALLSRYAKLLLECSGSARLAFGYASAAFASASRAGAFGLARLAGEGFEAQLAQMSASLQPISLPARRPATRIAVPASVPMAIAPTDDLPKLDDQLDSRLKLSTVLRSLVLIAGEPDPGVLVVRLMRIILQFTRADFGALALRVGGSGDLLLRCSGDFDHVQAYEVPLSSPLASSLAPADTMLDIDSKGASVSSRQQGQTTLLDTFFKRRPPSAFVGIALQAGQGVLFLSGAEFLLDLSTEGSNSAEVVGALINVASISLDSSMTRRSLEATVSERTAALEQALEAERSFLSVVSHELRTPLFSVLGLVTVLETSENLDDLQLGLLAQVRSSGEDLSRLINQVLDYSRLQSGVQDLEQIEFSLRDVVEQALDAVAARGQRKDLELVCDTAVSSDVPTLRGDAFKIKQIILNFLSNAVKFTNLGFIKVRWAQSVDAAGEPMVQVSVEDSGTGISEAQQKRLFQSFTQADASILRSHGGFGLGLSISRQLARALGGDAWVTSEVGKGSTFSFSFKAKFDEHPSPSQHIYTGSTPRRVLLYCPPPTLRDSLVMNLEAFGLTVDTESSDVGNSLKNELGVLRKPDPDRPGETIRYDVLLLSPENVDVGQIPVMRKLQPKATIRILPRIINAAADASRLEVSHASILSRPLKALALYRACQRDEDAVGAVPRKKNNGRLPGPTKAGSLNKGFALEHPLETILLVDDNPVNVSVGLKILSALGYSDVDTASDGRQAVEAAAEKPYELILLDLQMPVLDGFSAAAAIFSSTRTKDHPMIVALTANSDAFHRDECASNGFVAFLSKPLNIAHFKETLAQVSQKKRLKVNSSGDSDDGAEPCMDEDQLEDHAKKDAAAS